MTDHTYLQGMPLGIKTKYVSEYDPTLLFSIPRSPKRIELGIQNECPFQGYDIWNAFELSWLNRKGKPQVAVADFFISAASENIIESKSLKLYLNSYNNTHFNNRAEVLARLKEDLIKAWQGEAQIRLFTLDELNSTTIKSFNSFCLDDLDVECSVYHYDPNLLQAESAKIISDEVYSDLLKSNCLVTSQPDWGSINIAYTGMQISRASLLQYTVSFRNRNEFGEQCAERIFMDLYNKFKPQKLTVYVRYTRRGGLDINAIRSTDPVDLQMLYINNIRQPRQ